MKKKIISLLLASAMLVTCFTGCGQKEQTETQATDSTQKTEAKEEERKNFVFGDYVGSVDPASGPYSWVGIRVGAVEPLFKLDEKMQVQKNLVEDYSVSEDGLTWTLILRDGVKFQNGKAMDAEAVKASLLRVCELQTRAAEELKIASIETDGNTLKVTTKEPNPILPNCLCDPYSCIVDASELDKDGNATIGTGPFKLVEYVENERMELDAFDEYWGGVPASKHLTIRAINDLDASAMALQKGELDACYGLSYDARDLFDSDPNFKISQAATGRVYKVYFNLEHEFTKDPEFRRAICMAVDKENYGKVLINGAGTATKASFPENTAFGKDEEVKNVPDFDLKGAAKLLEEQGYVDTDGDGFREKDGKKVSLEMITYGRAGLPQSSQALQSALKEIGIDVSLEQLESTEDRGHAGTFDLSVYAEMTMPTGDPYSYMMSNFKTGGFNNFGKYSKPEVDQMLEELGVEFDTEKRNELAAKIDQTVLSDNSICNLFHLNMYMAMKTNVEGLNQSPVDYYHITHETCVK